MSIQNTPRKNGFLLRIIRRFFEHRALWLYFLCDEARKTGISPEKFAPNAIRRCGIYHGMKALTGKETSQRCAQLTQCAQSKQCAEINKDGVSGKAVRGSCRVLKKNLFTSVGKTVFEMKFLKLNDDEFDVDFHYCPLVTAWQKQGCSGEEIDKLCDWAMEGDRGIADVFGCTLVLEKTIAKGDGICQIRFKRK